MPLGYSAQKLTRDLRGKDLGTMGKKFQGYISQTSGKILPTGRVKGKIVDFLKYKSQRERNEEYKTWELNYKDKKKAENFWGGKTPEELREEKRIKEEREESNRGWTKLQRRKDEEKKGKVTDLDAYRTHKVSAAGSTKKADKKEEKMLARAETVKQAGSQSVAAGLRRNRDQGEASRAELKKDVLSRVLNVGGTRLGASALDIENKDRKMSKRFISEERTIGDQESSAQRPSLVTGKNIEQVAAGFGVKAKDSRLIKKEGNVLHVDFRNSGNLGSGGGGGSMRGTPPSFKLGGRL